MKLTSIPQIYRNLNRGTEILSVLSKYGLADWISHLNIDFAKGIFRDRDGAALARHTRERRIRLALTDLGPTFIKLGQLLSTRPDLVGVELAEELRQLQEAAPADSFATVKKIVEAELGRPLEELFAEFEETPIASASIGQVHRARMPSGQRVVVKVQHDGIQGVVARDLEVLGGLAVLAESLPEFKCYRPAETVAEFQRTLRRELDFGREEQNLLHFSRRFAENPHVVIPAPVSDYCTPRVLTMELIEGAKLCEPDKLNYSPLDLEEIARHGAEIYLQMIFTDGFYHADPHPGNFILLPGNVIGLIDFGMVGRVEDRLREDFEEMLMSILNRDAAMLAAIIMRIGKIPPGIDESALRGELTDFVMHYGTQSLEHFELSGALREMIEMIHRYHIFLPAQVGMLLKVLITLEGTSKQLNPKFSLMEVMQPQRRQMLLRRLSPVRRLRKYRRIYMELEQLAEALPRRIIDIFEQVQSGKFDIHLDHRGLGPSVNRLVLGMLASALFLGSSLLLSREVPPLLFPNEPFWGIHRLSIMGAAGCAVSVMLGLRLIRAIGKSGHIDRKE